MARLAALARQPVGERRCIRYAVHQHGRHEPGEDSRFKATVIVDTAALLLQLDEEWDVDAPHIFRTTGVCRAYGLIHHAMVAGDDDCRSVPEAGIFERRP